MIEVVKEEIIKIKILTVDTDKEDFHSARGPDDDGVVIVLNGRDRREIQMECLINELVSALHDDFEEDESKLVTMLHDDFEEKGTIEADEQTVALIRGWVELNDYGRKRVLSMLREYIDNPGYTKTDIIPFPYETFD